MASSYTENYGLCQWEATDSFVRTEFNQDNARIDAALKDLEDTKAEQAALSSLSATVSGKASQSSVNSLSTAVNQKCRMKAGTYTGSGSATGDSQTISMGFPVKAALVETIWSVGMLLGSVVLGFWGGTRNKMTAMTAALFCTGGCLLAVGGLSPAAFLAFTGLALGMGLASPFFNSMFTALIQEKVEGGYLGRVLGLTSAVMTLAGPVGLAATALFAERVGLGRWFALSGALTALCGVLCLALPAVRGCDGEKSQAVCTGG